MMVMYFMKTPGSNRFEWHNFEFLDSRNWNAWNGFGHLFPQNNWSSIAQEFKRQAGKIKILGYRTILINSLVRCMYKLQTYKIVSHWCLWWYLL